MPEINVLSGAAVEPGLLAAADIFRKRTGDRVNIAFATTPEMRRLVAADAAPDVFIAPPSALDEFARLGKVDAAARVTLGRVGVGVVVRDGAPLPDVSTTAALKRAVLDADAVIYNRASSGLYVEGLLQRLGLAEEIKAKTRRYTGTDSDALTLVRGGVPTAVVSIPNRYMHSPSEMIDERDARACIDLIAAWIRELEETPEFKR